MRYYLLITFICLNFISFAQESIDGVLNHTNGYFTMHPYSSSYDDGSHAKIFYDGNLKRIDFRNSDSNTAYTNLRIGSLKMNYTGVTETGFKQTFLNYSGHSFILSTDPGNSRMIVFELKPGGASGTESPSNIILSHAIGEGLYEKRIRLNTNGDNYLNGGNLGIGEEEPEAKLHVNNPIGAGPFAIIEGGGGVHENVSLRLYDRGSAAQNVNVLEFSHANSSNNPVPVAHIKTINRSSATAAGGDLIMETTNDANSNFNTHQLVLKNNGNIGMGTLNTSDYKLSVNGKIRADEVKVYTGWADYVFKEGYQLRSIKELESYIKLNGHLPNVPSEETVLEEGINVGEMNSILLEKIEELTLYTIEQEKKIEALKAEKTDMRDNYNERLELIEKQLKALQKQ